MKTKPRQLNIKKANFSEQLENIKKANFSEQLQNIATSKESLQVGIEKKQVVINIEKKDIKTIDEILTIIIDRYKKEYVNDRYKKEYVNDEYDEYMLARFYNFDNLFAVITTNKWKIRVSDEIQSSFKNGYKKPTSDDIELKEELFYRIYGMQLGLKYCKSKIDSNDDFNCFFNTYMLDFSISIIIKCLSILKAKINDNKIETAKDVFTELKSLLFSEQRKYDIIFKIIFVEKKIIVLK